MQKKEKSGGGDTGGDGANRDDQANVGVLAGDGLRRYLRDRDMVGVRVVIGVRMAVLPGRKGLGDPATDEVVVGNVAVLFDSLVGVGLVGRISEHGPVGIRFGCSRRVVRFGEIRFNRDMQCGVAGDFGGDLASVEVGILGLLDAGKNGCAV